MKKNGFVADLRGKARRCNHTILVWHALASKRRLFAIWDQSWKLWIPLPLPSNPISPGFFEFGLFHPVARSFSRRKNSILADPPPRTPPNPPRRGDRGAPFGSLRPSARANGAPRSPVSAFSCLLFLSRPFSFMLSPCLISPTDLEAGQAGNPNRRPGRRGGRRRGGRPGNRGANRPTNRRERPGASPPDRQNLRGLPDKCP